MANAVDSDFNLHSENVQERVGVVILNWNNADLTKISIDSVRASDYPEYHIYVVDNGSNRSDYEKLAAVSDQPQITLVRNSTNSGFSSGNNIGIRLALQDHSKYILLLNNDAKITASTVTEFVKCAQSYPEAGIFGGVIYDWDSDKNIQLVGGGRINFALGRAPLYKRAKGLENIDFISGAFMLTRDSVYRCCGLMDESYFLYWEDAEFSIRAKNAGWKLHVCHEAKAWHKASSSLGTHNPMFDYYITKSSMLFFRQFGVVGWWPISISIIFRLLKHISKGNISHVKSVVRGVRDYFRNAPDFQDRA